MIASIDMTDFSPASIFSGKFLAVCARIEQISMICPSSYSSPLASSLLSSMRHRVDYSPFNIRVRMERITLLEKRTTGETNDEKSNCKIMASLVDIIQFPFKDKTITVKSSGPKRQ